jgi:hypothetical protein
MIAAKTIMLRIRKTRSETADFTMPARKLRPAIPGWPRDFAEKDERSVNSQTVIRGLVAESSKNDGLPGQARQ